MTFYCFTSQGVLIASWFKAKITNILRIIVFNYLAYSLQYSNVPGTFARFYAALSIKQQNIGLVIKEWWVESALSTTTHIVCDKRLPLLGVAVGAEVIEERGTHGGLGQVGEVHFYVEECVSLVHKGLQYWDEERVVVGVLWKQGTWKWRRGKATGDRCQCNINKLTTCTLSNNDFLFLSGRCKNVLKLSLGIHLSSEFHGPGWKYCFKTLFWDIALWPRFDTNF